MVAAAAAGAVDASAPELLDAGSVLPGYHRGDRQEAASEAGMVTQYDVVHTVDVAGEAACEGHGESRLRWVLEAQVVGSHSLVEDGAQDGMRLSSARAEEGTHRNRVVEVLGSHWVGDGT